MITTFIIVGSLIASSLLGWLFRLHIIHALLGGCQHRTNTRSQAVFQLSRFYVANRKANVILSERDVIIFDFQQAAPNLFLEIPSGSRWHSVRHAHLTKESCISIQALSGRWFLGSMRAWNPPVLWGPQGVQQWMDFGHDDPDGNAATAKLIGSEQTQRLYHTIASVVQDAEAYFALCTTPIWIRTVYWFAGLISQHVRDWIVQRVLWIQLRMIFYQNDFLESHGACYIFRRVYWVNPPRWVPEFEAWSEFAIARIVLWWNYWLGRTLFGMSADYPEYAMVKGSHTK
ncbi:hypothetical protein CDV55_107512 [Aspergillus turcosus]|uniref:Uncharacterized protein n=1 Tax=Aspergillus turcosus TaxID=1245748 RepID=A0A229YTL4_9EURO|nr:hypothetical protein CDV55_107512 [Aspergillus turcosus]RLL97654.1 hypothetical protein CFD26_102850 [Aspergillus turcosus]